MEPVSVGLIGAGPWAEMVHAPALAAGPNTRLAGVWARRPEAADELAGRYRAPSFERLDDLFGVCEAVAFCVPPAVQADLGVRAARAGKALLLEKPLAADLEAAERLVDAIDEAGVASQMVFTFRYSPATKAFLEKARRLKPFGGYAANMHESHRGGGFLVREGLGAGESGVTVDGGVQVDIATAAGFPLDAVRVFGLVAAAAVDSPSATVGDPADLLHVDVDQVARPSGDDLSWLTVRVAVRVDEPAAADPERGKVTRDGAAGDLGSLGGQLVGDAGGGPLVLAAHGLDSVYHVR